MSGGRCGKRKETVDVEETKKGDGNFLGPF
jgi:hypothetical protein